MTSPQRHILLISDNENDYVTTKTLLNTIEGQTFILDRVITYQTALTEINCDDYQVYLIDYHLDNNKGLKLLQEAIKRGCNAPLILLTGQDDRTIDLKAMEVGAADYLVKETLTPALLERSIRYAIGRKRTEEALRKSEDRFRQVVSSVNDHIYVGNLTETASPISNYISPNVEGLTGYPRQKFLDDWDFWRGLIHLDDLKIAINRPETFLNNHQDEIEYRLKHANGSLIWVRDSRQIKVEKGTGNQPNQVTIYGVVSNITERKQAEEALKASEERSRQAEKRYRSLFEQAPIMYVITRNENGKALITDCNELFLKTLGYKRTEVLHKPLADFYTTDVNPQVLLDHLQQLNTKGYALGEERHLLTKNGEIVDTLLHSVPEMNTNGQKIGTQAMFIDITKRKRADIELQERAVQLTLINNMWGKIAGVLNVDIVLDRATNLLQKAFDYHHVALFLIEDDKLQLKSIARSYTLSPNKDYNEILGQGIVGWVATNGKRLLANDINKEPRYIPSSTEKTVIKAELGMPIKVAGETRGVLDIQSPHLNAFSKYDVLVVAILADQIAVAMENANLYTESQRRTENLAALNKAGRAMASTLDMDIVLNQTMTQANALLNTERASVILIDDNSNQLYFAAVAGANTENLLGSRLPPNAGIAGWTMQNRKSVLVNDAQTDSRLYRGIDEILDLTTHSLLAVPLMQKERIMGVVEVINKTTGDFNQHDLEMLEALTNSAALAIENARLFDETKQRAKQLSVLHEQLRHLNQKVVSAQEEERQRLSRELHDETGQALTALKITLELIHADFPPEAKTLSENMKEAIALTGTTMDRLRALARDLRPPALDTAGLNPTLDGLCRDFAHRSQVTINYTGTEISDSSDTINICLYRVLQESLTNIAKHAQATNVTVSLEHNPTNIKLIIKDNGRGFDYQNQADMSGKPTGIGLLGMQERIELLGGVLQIESQLGEGTSLTAQVPLEKI